MVVKMQNPLLEVSEIKVSYCTSDNPKIKINSGDTAYSLLMSLWNMDTIELQEEFKVVLLNRANDVLGVYSLSKGGITGTVVDQRLIFAVALKCNATGIILCHNHPSGNLKPSDADVTMTSKIKKCGELFDISLLDHLIISRAGYYSFTQEGNFSLRV